MAQKDGNYKYRCMRVSRRLLVSGAVLGYVTISCNMPFLCHFSINTPMGPEVSVFVWCLPFPGVYFSLCASADVSMVICVLVSRACHICLRFLTHSHHLWDSENPSFLVLGLYLPD